MSGLLKIITPVNLDKEYHRFINSNHYHPIFKYHWRSNLTQHLKKTSPKTNLIKAILTQDHQKITNTAQSLFSTNIDPQIVRLAQKITASPPPRLRHPTINQVINAFNKAFHYFNLDYQAVVSSQSGFNVRPKQTQKLVLISRRLNLNFFSLSGLVKHELSHVIRYENGLFNHIKRSPDYLPTEEGLATFVQDHQGSWSQKSKFQHAAEYLASAISLDGSLRDIYDFFRSLGFPKELAWQRAIRHKFGFINTRQAGGIIKPAMYFNFSQKISQLTPQQRLKLYIGKISLKDLSQHQKYIGRFTPKQIRHFFEI